MDFQSLVETVNALSILRTLFGAIYNLALFPLQNRSTVKQLYTDIGNCLVNFDRHRDQIQSLNQPENFKTASIVARQSVTRLRHLRDTFWNRLNPGELIQRLVEIEDNLLHAMTNLDLPPGLHSLRLQYTEEDVTYAVAQALFAPPVDRFRRYAIELFQYLHENEANLDPAVSWMMIESAGMLYLMSQMENLEERRAKQGIGMCRRLKDIAREGVVRRDPNSSIFKRIRRTLKRIAGGTNLQQIYERLFEYMGKQDLRFFTQNFHRVEDPHNHVRDLLQDLEADVRELQRFMPRCPRLAQSHEQIRQDMSDPRFGAQLPSYYDTISRTASHVPVDPITRTFQQDGDIGEWGIAELTVFESDIIGSGGDGKVHRAELRLQNGDFVVVAAKTFLNSRDFRSNRHRERARQETHLWENMNHDNILKLYGVHEFNSNVYILMELCNHGSLGSYIDNGDELEMKVKVGLALDLAQALDYLHTVQRVVHSDVKPENMLLFRNEQGGFKAKLCDFGIAVGIDLDAEPRIVYTGTKQYKAPELLRGQTSLYASPSVDIYAFGVTLWALLTGRQPYEDLSDHEYENLDQDIMATEDYRRPSQPGERFCIDCPDLENLVRQCWDPRPQNRPDAATIVQTLQSLQVNFQ